MRFKLLVSTAELTKFRFGYLLKDILDRSSSKCAGTLNPNRKIWMYSSHDTALFSILGGLRIIGAYVCFYINTVIKIISFVILIV